MRNVVSVAKLITGNACSRLDGTNVKNTIGFVKSNMQVCIESGVNCVDDQ